MPYPTNYNLMNPQQQYMNYFSQPMQQQMPMNQLSTGKIVDSIDMVKVIDIPMDGNSYYFPKADGSEVYAKKWLPNGSTEISTFVKSFNEEAKKEEFDFNLLQSNIFEKLDLIDDRIAKLEKGLTIKASSKKE